MWSELSIDHFELYAMRSYYAAYTFIYFKAQPSRKWKVLIEPSLRVILSLDLLQSSNILSIDGLQ